MNLLRAFRKNDFTIIIILPVLFTIFFSFFSLSVIAYDHKKAHISINAFAFYKFVYDVSHDYSGKYKRFKNYKFKEKIYKFEGYTVKDTSKHRLEKMYQKIKNEEILKKGNYQFWIASGGYTADLPEYYSALRHFYDPLKLQIDNHTGKRVSYLTDHTVSHLLLDSGLKKTVTDPRMDAREWALTGPARRGYKENLYSLRRGVEYMRRAWAEKDKKMKDKFFAAAWRACGETMHLLADMTVPAHVRNDAHPTGNVFSGLRFDPYEYYVTSNNPNKGNVIKKFYNGKVDSKISQQIDSSKTAAKLFHQVALFTNHNFFSADTLTGINHKGERVRSANTFRDYPSPSLNSSKVSLFGVYRDNRTGFSVAHADWAENTWWNLKNYIKQASVRIISATAKGNSYEDVVMEQAKILIPVAMKANSKLLEMFIPKLEVKLLKYNDEEKVLKGKIKHIVSGVYFDPTLNPHKKPLMFNHGPDSWSRLTINNRPYSSVMKDYKLQIKENSFAIAISNNIKLDNKRDNIASLELFFGGFWVKSNKFKIQVDPKKKKVKSTENNNSGTKTGRWVLYDTIKYKPCKSFKNKCHIIDVCVLNEGNFKFKKRIVCTGTKEVWHSGFTGTFTVPPKSITPGDKYRFKAAVKELVKDTKSGLVWVNAAFYSSNQGFSIDKKGKASLSPDWHHKIVRADFLQKNSDEKFVVPKNLNKNGILIFNAGGTGGNALYKSEIFYLYKWQE